MRVDATTAGMTSRVPSDAFDTVTAVAGEEPNNADGTRAAGTRVRYFGDYELSEVLGRGAWAWSTRPGKSALIVRWPSR